MNKLKAIHLEPVKSSNITGIAHEEKTNKLYVQFSNGSLYSYDDVPKELFGQLRVANSTGRFFMVFIKGKYVTEKLKGPDKNPSIVVE